MSSCTGAAPSTCCRPGSSLRSTTGLPIGPRYPGLEEVTSALISVTGLPIFVGRPDRRRGRPPPVHLLALPRVPLRQPITPGRRHRDPGLLQHADAELLRRDVRLRDARAGLPRAQPCSPPGGRRRALSRGRDGGAGSSSPCSHLRHRDHPPCHQLHAGGLAAAGRAGQPAHRARHTAHMAARWPSFRRRGGLLGGLRRARTRSPISGPRWRESCRASSALQSGSSSHAPSTSSSPLRQPVAGRHRHPGHHYPAAARLVASLAASPIPSVDRGHGDRVARLVRRAGPPRRDPGRPGAGRATGDLRLHPRQPRSPGSPSSSWSTARPGAWESAAIAVAADAEHSRCCSTDWPTAGRPTGSGCPGRTRWPALNGRSGREEIATAQWTLSALGPGNRFAADIGIYPSLVGLRRPEPAPEHRLTFTSGLRTPGDRAGRPGSGGAVHPGRPAAEPVAAGLRQLLPRVTRPSPATP